MDLLSMSSRATIGLGQLLAQVDARASSPTVGTAPTGGGGGGGAPAADGGGWMQFVLMGVFFLVFYFLVLRPQSQRAKKHKAFIDSLQVGTRVVLSGGLFGKITALEGAEAKVEIADRVVVRVLRSQILGLETNAAEAVADAAQK